MGPYLDASLPVDRRVDDLISRLSLAEKVGQMLHEAPAISRVGVPEYNWWNECLHGVGRAGSATVFPQAIGMAASFDTALLHRVASAISDEARAKHHQALRQGNRGQYFGLTFWSPNINIFRDPRWGRGQETYGEDPYLTGRLGVAFVKGLQGDDPRYLKLVATPKHFAVHSGPELKRHQFNAEVSPRDLYETYLPAFKACVQQGRAASVMGAYNRTNGEPCCASATLLQDILRGRWGFDGYVVSDCGAINDIHEHHRVTRSAAESAALAVRNGCDLNCGWIFGHLLDAVGAGLIDEAEIDAALRRLLCARFRLGMFDSPERVPYASIPAGVVNCSEHRELARQMARESIVLLKNESHLLPLSKEVGCIAVVGPNACEIGPLLGNYYGYSPRMVTLLEGIVAAVSPGTQVLYAQGCELTGDRPIESVKWVRQADVIVAALGFSPRLEGEEGEVADSDGGGDRLHIGLPGRQGELLEALHASGKPVVLVLTGGSPIAVNWAAENVPAILMAWYPGEQGGHAVADVLFGECSPGGRLPVTFVRSLHQIPPFDDYRMAGRTYRFMESEPLYRFGYGLSYSAFAYTNLRLGRDRVGLDETVDVSVDVTNTGGRGADEVVQLYVTDVQASVPVPLRHLEGFKRIHLGPGRTSRVTFALTSDQLAAYDDEGRPFVEPGEFLVSVGGGQPDDPASGAVSTKLTVV
jgi:beta-glucosidase